MSDPLSSLGSWLLPAATARFVLLANHVLTAAPPATERLRAHAGRVLSVEVQSWPFPLLPAPPALTLRISPAGLFEEPEAGSSQAPDLRLRVDAAQPLNAARQMVTGGMPPVHIEGDAGLAADVSWVLANVRWDIAADLERVFGPVFADGLSRAGEQAMAAARQLAETLAGGLRKP